MGVLTGCLCVLLVAGVVYGAGLLQGPVLPEVGAQEVEIAPSSVALVCPGPARLADGEWDRDAAFDPVPVGTKSGSVGFVAGEGALADEVRGLGESGTGSWRRGGDGAVAVRGEGAGVFAARPDAAGRVLAAATAWSVTTAGDLRGLAAMSCPVPATEQWLVGGETLRGSSSRLVLQNASRTPASVEVDVWGPNGRVQLSGPATFSVPAEGQIATLLEGLVGQQRRLAVRVRSSGVPVSAYLQVNALDGLRPAGVEFVGSAAAPAKRQVVTGLVVGSSQIGDEASASVRLLVPGKHSASARVTILGADGRVLLPGTERVDLQAGAVMDVSFAGLAAGTYSVVVESAEPVVVAGRVVRGPRDGDADSPTDRSLIPARSPGGVGVVALPQDVSAQLALFAVPQDPGAVPVASGDGDDDVPEAADPGGAGAGAAGVAARVEVFNAEGRIVGSRVVDVDSGRTASVDLQGIAPDAHLAGVRVSASGGGSAQDSGLSWSVLLRAGADGDELASVILPVPPVETATTLSLRPGDRAGLGIPADAGAAAD